MNTVVLIACASKKLRQPARAEDLYISDLFRKNLQYAHTLKPSLIFILSAKYGLLGAGDEIAPYNVTLNKMSSHEIRAWSERVIGQLEVRADIERDHFVLLAGDRYRRYLVPRLRSVEVPMAGLGIGQQLNWLKRRLS